MGKEKRNLSLVRKDSGQSVVEYVLLLAVLTFIASMIIRSPLFKQWMGQDSLLFVEMRRQMVYSYCNPMPARPDSVETCEHDYSTVLESYRAAAGSDEGTRFFIPADEYP